MSNNVVNLMDVDCQKDGSQIILTVFVPTFYILFNRQDVFYPFQNISIEGET